MMNYVTRVLCYTCVVLKELLASGQGVSKSRSGVYRTRSAV